MRIIITPEAARGALKIIGIYLAGVFLISFLVFLFCDNANAESAIVSFDDAEHLVALTDSICGACDTVMVIDTATVFSSTVSTESWEWIGLSGMINVLWIDTVAVDTAYNIFYEINRPVITCRKFVGRTVMPNVRLWEWLMNPSRIRMRPMTWQAIIDYKEVKQ